MSTFPVRSEALEGIRVLILLVVLFITSIVWSATMRMFLSECITSSDLKLGKLYLELFCKKFGTLYGEKHMGINVHSLLHLASTVEELGPLWAFPASPGLLLKNVHGTQGIALQCMCTYRMIQAFPAHASELFPPESQLEQLQFVREVVGAASLLRHFQQK